jgi:hypothetical protein
VGVLRLRPVEDRYPPSILSKFASNLLIRYSFFILSVQKDAIMLCVRSESRCCARIFSLPDL